MALKLMYYIVVDTQNEKQKQTIKRYKGNIYMFAWELILLTLSVTLSILSDTLEMAILISLFCCRASVISAGDVVSLATTTNNAIYFTTDLIYYFNNNI